MIIVKFMGLFRAILITTIIYGLVKLIHSQDKKLENIPIINKLIKNRINYCYIILILVFLLELIL